MRRAPWCPAQATRAGLLLAERRARTEQEHHAVTAGVAETVALSRGRGSAFSEPEPGHRGPRATPYRRQAGLDWLAAKGRIGPAAKAAGERYGAVYRRVKLESPIRSTLDVQPGGGRAPEVPIGQILSHGEGTVRARERLAALRARLWRQPDLVAACDLICGEEKTPREAAGADRDAVRLEAVLKVALDVLAGVHQEPR